MAIDLVFEADNANIVNLQTLSNDMNLLDERRICELYEIAEKLVVSVCELTSVGMSVCEILSLMSESDIIHGASKSDRAIFCSLVYELFEKNSIPISEESFLPIQNMPETFTYVKNSFADEAYDIFSQEFEAPRVLYSQSFKEALSLVSDGTVSYCLLPIEERGSRLSTVSELLFKGDFKIVSVTPILGFDGLADMKYAIISRSFSSLTFDSDDDRYLELRLNKNSNTSLAEILSSASYYGLALYKLNTMRFDTDDGNVDYFSVVFEVSGADFTKMLIYLTLFVDEFVPVGVYKNIE